MITGGKKHKSNYDIAREWDTIAVVRSEQLMNHKDISMDDVLHPLLKSMSSDCDLTNVVDLGCGTGYTTRFFSVMSDNIIGIDFSPVSIELAKLNYPNLNFEVNSIEEFSLNSINKYTLAIANMTLMDAPDLEAVIKSTSILLKDNSFLVLTITHPYFWPLYWGYDKSSWFQYSKEIEIEANFNISLIESSFITTHFHRPLETYVNLLRKYNLEIIELSEPMPQNEIMNKYPSKWEYPRFIGIKCRKIRLRNPKPHQNGF